MFTFIELSDLIGYYMVMRDIQDGLKCWRIGLKVCGKHHLMTRFQVSDQGPKGRLIRIKRRQQQ